MDKNSNGVLTDEELNRLEETRKYRLRIIENAFHGESVPDSAKDIEAINGVLNSLDKNVMDLANARLKQAENMNKDAVLDIVASTLKSIQNDKLKYVNQDREVELDDKLVPTDMVAGETDITPETVTLDDIMKED